MQGTSTLLMAGMFPLLVALSTLIYQQTSQISANLSLVLFVIDMVSSYPFLAFGQSETCSVF